MAAMSKERHSGHSSPAGGSRKKDPNAELSEPVKPIVYYIDQATPMKWRPYMIKAINDWQPAFEAAGFKNAIIGKMAPTKAEDPDFSPEDARYAVVRWLPSTTENASGPHISDPRTGEILDSDIQFYHNVMNLAKSWYFLQVGHLDPRVQKFPIPDEVMGRLLEYVLAHEVGPYAWLSAQYEGELRVSPGKGTRQELGPHDGPYADADGLLAI